MMSNIPRWLAKAGLSRYQDAFRLLTDSAFCNLLHSQLPTFGVTDPDDKAKLNRAIKAAAAEVQQGGPSHLDVGHKLDNAGLLDLEADDGDLVSQHGFQMSPLGHGKSRPGGGGGAAAAAAAPAVGPAGSIEDADPPKICVVVRKRPMNRKEVDKGEDDIVEVNGSRSYVVVNETKVKVDLTKYVERHQFNFDVSLDESVSQDLVYRATVMPLVPTLFKAGKATCFAYGQTGSGKTHTMSPLPIRAAADILQYLAMPQHSDISLLTSCFEIYGNKCFDLLNSRKKLNILEDGKKMVVVVGLKEFNVTNVDVVKQLIERANQQRSTGSTAANADSSRSHSIMQFALKKPSADGSGRLVGKISFIDLAGSERGADTYDNNRQTRLEGAEINKSLLALKECIRALDSDARHVPFRGSKLTAVLRDSFVGDQARTVMIANISPNSTSVEHTLNTLRYADRVKELRKDKADRTAGGVTPGEAPGYYAAVQRAVEQPAGHAAGQRPAGLHNAPFQAAAPAAVAPQPPAVAAHNGVAAAQQRGHVEAAGSPTRVAPRASAVASPTPPQQHPQQAAPAPGDDELDHLLYVRDELMNTILEEEEDLIHAHRTQIEAAMDIVSKEMALLTDVDQPGSAIDQYVIQLEGILDKKLEGINALKAKLESFKGKLREEEILSKTMSGKHARRHIG